jgi:CRP-like cAMP-binding protein
MAYKTKAWRAKVIAATANPGLVRPSFWAAPVSRKRRAALPKKGRVSFDPKTFLTRVGDGRSLAKYRKGEIVFSQGKIGDAVFFIQKGKVKVTVVSEQGKEAVVAILGTGEFFGEGCLAGQLQRMSTVTVMTDANIVRLEKAAIVR